jgi:TonB-linked SusC/RagA family outer membrane protein
MQLIAYGKGSFHALRGRALLLSHQNWLIMKLTTALLLVGCLQVSARVHAQTVTLDLDNVPLVAAFKQIQRQTGYAFIFSNRDLANAKTVTIHRRQAALDEVLQACLAGQPLVYQLFEKTIIIKARPQTPVETLPIPLSPIDVHGRVVDDKNEPVPDVNVNVKNGSRATVTDKDGYFLLKGVDERAVIILSAIGFKTSELYVRGEMGTIRLEISRSKLDQVVIIGYGTTTQRLSTGAVDNVTSAEIERQPVSNPILTLEGRVPGLFITQNAGYSGANMAVSIRGQNSLNNSAPLYTGSPLYVIDGIPFGSAPVEQSSGGFSAGANTGFSPLNTINAADIESISVLKDADATAIYGARGGNGVILITTKKGRGGSTQFNVDLSSGLGEATHRIPLLSTEQYLNIRKQAFANDGVTPTTTNAPDLTVWSQTAHTDFPKLLIGRTSHQDKGTISVSGGDNYTQFLFGGNYRHESTVYHTSTADNAGQFFLNLQHRSHDEKFGISVSTSYNVDNNTVPAYSLSSANYSLPPNYPVYNPNGSLYFGTGYTNPLAALNIQNNMKSDNLLANTGVHYMLLPGLDVKVSLGYNRINVEGATIAPPSAFNPATVFTTTSTLNNNYIKTYIAEPQINYSHTWGKGKLTALLGGTWQETQNVQPYFVVGTFTNIELARSLGALTVLVKSSGYTDYKYASEFGRIAYQWNNKYLVSGNLRRDGSSRFGSDRQFGTFGSIAGAWIFSNEGFIRNSLPWLSYGKIKSSYGTVGNDRIGDYSYESVYFNQAAYGPVNGLVPGNIANPYLQWEVTKKLDAGIELGFIQDRVLISAGYYRNRTSNLLGSTGLAAQVGSSNYNTNLPGTVQNKGIELELTTVNIKNSRKFSWTTSLNLTMPNNKLLAFPNLASSVYANTYVLGHSLNPIRVYSFAGFQNGIATVNDINKDGVITYGLNANGKGDLILDGDSDPRIYGGLNNSFSYKGFQLDILFQAVKRKAQRGDLSFAAYPGRGYDIPSSLVSLPLKYSATSGTPAANAWSYYTGSDAAIEDASFVRLKNVSLAYHLPQEWIKRLRLSSAQVYLHGQNLLTFTKYKGQDPETLSNSLPPLKMLIAGIQVTF